MSERPTDGDVPPAKKRINDRQLTKDDDDEEDEEAIEQGNFQKASEDVLKARKIVKARRGLAAVPASAAPPAADAGGNGTSNPFAGINLAAPGGKNPFTGFTLVPPAASKPVEGGEAAAKGCDEGEGGADKTGSGEDEGKDRSEHTNAAATTTTGLFGSTGAGTSLFPTFGGVGSTGGGFGTLAKTGGGFGSLAASSAPFSFASSTPATGGGFAFASASGDAASTDVQPVRSVFGSASGAPAFAGTSGDAKASASTLPAEEDTRTGEEDEKCVFSGEGLLFEFDAGKAWRERGRGEMRVNVAQSGQARLVMRQKGNLRLLMNAALWPEMVVAKMEGGKAATFAVLNDAAAAGAPASGEPSGSGADAKEAEEGGVKAEDKAGAVKLTTYAFRVKPVDKLEAFMTAMNEYKTGASANGADRAAENGDKA